MNLEVLDTELLDACKTDTAEVRWHAFGPKMSRKAHVQVRFAEAGTAALAARRVWERLGRAWPLRTLLPPSPFPTLNLSTTLYSLPSIRVG